MAAPEPSYVRVAELVKPHDGDSFYARLDHGAYPNTRVEATIMVRVRALYCPELGTELGRKAAEFAASCLECTSKLTIQSFRTKGGFARGTLARVVCDVWIGDNSFAETMIQAGHGFATAEAREAALAS